VGGSEDLDEEECTCVAVGFGGDFECGWDGVRIASFGLDEDGWAEFCDSRGRSGSYISGSVAQVYTLDGRDEERDRGRNSN
jgi:hypothetical protein